MKYLGKSFSVAVGTSQAARDGWERTFGKKCEHKSKRVYPNPVDIEPIVVCWDCGDILPAKGAP